MDRNIVILVQISFLILEIGLSVGRGLDMIRKWENGIVPYEFSDELTGWDKRRLERAFEFFSDKTCIAFRPKTDFDSDYIHIRRYHHAKGKGGMQIINLEVESCWRHGTLIHELFHVLGFSHEEQRDDRDEYVTIHWSIIPKSWVRQYRKLGELGLNHNDVGDYDYASIMHMPRYNPQFGSGPVMTAKLSPTYWNNLDMGNRVTPTREDQRKVNLMYRCGN